MKLTIKENRNALKRYRDIKRARGPQGTHCHAACPGSGLSCTREQGHSGPHAAHRFLKGVVAVWDSGADARVSGDVTARVSEARTTNAVRTSQKGESVGLLKSLGVRVVSSAEDIALLFLFLAFVWFAFDWFKIIGG